MPRKMSMEFYTVGAHLCVKIELVPGEYMDFRSYVLGGETTAKILAALLHGEPSLPEKSIPKSKPKAEKKKKKKNEIAIPHPEEQMNDEESFAVRLTRTGRMPTGTNKETVLFLAAEYFDVTGDEVCGSAKRGVKADARRVVYYVCSTVLEMTDKLIGDFLHKSQTRVFQSNEKVRARIAPAKVLKAVEEITNILGEEK